MEDDIDEKLQRGFQTNTEDFEGWRHKKLLHCNVLEQGTDIFCHVVLI